MEGIKHTRHINSVLIVWLRKKKIFKLVFSLSFVMVSSQGPDRFPIIVFHFTILLQEHAIKYEEYLTLEHGYNPLEQDDRHFCIYNATANVI